MKNKILSFLKSRSGATAIEYGLIVALLSLVITAAVGNVGNELSSMFSDQDRALQQAFD
ncbi:MAG: Flp family type IVb pilin [Alphaproteobacteria bacterium]|jgi:pilus assembly protein Flp/PilA|nr:Flp family type IVb pilin [Alphaproteobacteria bacterium]MBU0804889.1 Flp family type IVb pilin [Alphaproteobacteria bacterium]MBU0870388.1 Flp family type IVb pilin [Alphaproteobacteria bacterium]MBU1401937.1 Flp family type IVb pilin [Alphaproteobacteria bacterium]MBU1591646.1 Flp family type IVb pilin [Alphaproteobacteria bacterium]